MSAEFTLVYTEIGREIVFGSGQRLPAMPEDEARALDYVAHDQPKVLEGWKAGQGAPKFKAQRLRKLEGLESRDVADTVRHRCDDDASELLTLSASGVSVKA